MKLTQHLVKFICVNEKKGVPLKWVWFWSTVAQMGPSHLLMRCFCLSWFLTSLMENLCLGTGCEKESLGAWKQQEARFGFNQRTGVCKVFSILDALESHWLCSLAQDQNKQIEVPTTVTGDLLISTTPWTPNSRALPGGITMFPNKYWPCFHDGPNLEPIWNKGWPKVYIFSSLALFCSKITCNINFQKINWSIVVFS